MPCMSSPSRRNHRNLRKIHKNSIPIRYINRNTPQSNVNMTPLQFNAIPYSTAALSNHPSKNSLTITVGDHIATPTPILTVTATLVAILPVSSRS